MIENKSNDVKMHVFRIYSDAFQDKDIKSKNGDEFSQSILILFRVATTSR